MMGPVAGVGGAFQLPAPFAQQCAEGLGKKKLLLDECQTACSSWLIVQVQDPRGQYGHLSQLTEAQI